MKREIAVFLIITMVLSLSACGKTLKGTDGLIEKAREEIPISDSDTIDLQYAGMCGNDNRAIAWFISGNEYQKHYYLPMEVEVKELKEQMQITRQLTKAGMEFCEGILEGQDVVVVRSGVGKVNAAVCTQILIDVFDVKAVINTGIAGSLKAEINIGDLVISSDLVHHDMDAVSFGYPKGQIPQMDVFSFEADKALADLAEKVCEEVNPEIQVFHGRVVSGDQFIADKETKENISTLFAGYCTEMEGAAIAQTAHLNEVPFVVLRAISDKADDSASMDYPTFEKKAAEHCAKLVEEFIVEL